MLLYNNINHDVKVLENEIQIVEIFETFHFGKSGVNSGILII